MALFEGCGTALITPFKYGEVDYPALDNLVESQIEAGVDALIAAGIVVGVLAAMGIVWLVKKRVKRKSA